MTTDIRTVTFTARETAEVISEKRDIALSPNQICGRTEATLVSPGTELNGGYLGDSFPRTPGYSAVFTVEAVGTDVTGIAPGDRRYCMGNHTSYQLREADSTLPVPVGLDAEIAIYARLMGVTMTTLVTTVARPPDAVLVTGLGPVGNLGAQNFAANGYKVIGCDLDAERRELAHRLGIPEVVERPEDASVAGEIALQLDCSGYEAAVLDGAKTIRKGGEIVLVGSPWSRRTDRYAHELTHAIFFNYLHVRSGWEWELPHRPEQLRPRSIFGNQATALEWLADGKVRVDGLGVRVDPTDAQVVYQSLLNKTSECPTAIFDWSSE